MNTDTPAMQAALSILRDAPDLTFEELIALCERETTLYVPGTREAVQGASVARALARLQPRPIAANFTVYHATDEDTADTLLRRGFIPETKPENRSDSYGPGRGLDRWLYVGKTPRSVESYGPVTLAVQIDRASLRVPTEQAQLGVRDPMKALAEHDGATVASRLPPTSFSIVRDHATLRHAAAGVTGLPSVEERRNRIRVAALAGEKGKDWYKEAEKEINTVARAWAVDPIYVAVAVAATSPATPVISSPRMKRGGGEASNIGKARAVVKREATQGHGSSALNPETPGITALFRYEKCKDEGRPSPDCLQVAFPNPDKTKTHAFVRNLIGYTDPVTVDTLVSREVAGRSITVTPARHKAIGEDIRAVAAELGWEPRQVMAAVWTAAGGTGKLGLATIEERARVNRGGHSQPGRARHAAAHLPEDVEKEEHEVLLDWVEEHEGKRYRIQRKDAESTWHFWQEIQAWTKVVARLCGSRDRTVRDMALAAWQRVPAGDFMLGACANVPVRQLMEAVHALAQVAVSMNTSQVEESERAIQAPLYLLEDWLGGDVKVSLGSVDRMLTGLREAAPPPTRETSGTEPLYYYTIYTLIPACGALREVIQATPGVPWKQGDAVAHSAVQTAFKAAYALQASGQLDFEAARKVTGRLVAAHIPDPSVSSRELKGTLAGRARGTRVQNKTAHASAQEKRASVNRGGHSPLGRSRHAAARAKTQAEEVLLDWVEENRGKPLFPHKPGLQWYSHAETWTKEVAGLCASPDPTLQKLALSAWQEMPSGYLMVQQCHHASVRTLAQIGHDCVQIALQELSLRLSLPLLAQPSDALALLQQWISDEKHRFVIEMEDMEPALLASEDPEDGALLDGEYEITRALADATIAATRTVGGSGVRSSAGSARSELLACLKSLEEAYEANCSRQKLNTTETQAAMLVPERVHAKIVAHYVPNPTSEDVPVHPGGKRETTRHAAGRRVEPGGPPRFDFSPGIHETKVGDTTLQYQYGARDMWRPGTKTFTRTNTVNLASMRTPQTKRGKGSARAAMQAFIEALDAAGLPATLGASPLDKRTHLGKLIRFYESFGFERTGRGINPIGHPEMYRPARESHPGARYGSRGHAKASLGSRELDAEAVLLDWVEEHEGIRHVPGSTGRESSSSVQEWESAVAWGNKVVELCGSRDPSVRQLALDAWRALKNPTIVLQICLVHAPVRRVVEAVSACGRVALKLSDSGMPTAASVLDAVDVWVKQPSSSEVQEVERRESDLAREVNQYTVRSNQYASALAVALGSDRPVEPRLQGLYNARVEVNLGWAMQAVAQIVHSTVARRDPDIVLGEDHDEVFYYAKEALGDFVEAASYRGVDDLRRAAAGPGASAEALVAAELSYLREQKGQDRLNFRTQNNIHFVSYDRKAEFSVREAARNAMAQECARILTSHIPDPTGRTAAHALAQRNATRHATARYGQLPGPHESVLLDMIEEEEGKRPDHTHEDWTKKVNWLHVNGKQEARALASDTWRDLPNGEWMIRQVHKTVPTAVLTAAVADCIEPILNAAAGPVGGVAQGSRAIQEWNAAKRVLALARAYPSRPTRQQTKELREAGSLLSDDLDLAIDDDSRYGMQLIDRAEKSKSKPKPISPVVLTNGIMASVRAELMRACERLGTFTAATWPRSGPGDAVVGAAGDALKRLGSAAAVMAENEAAWAKARGSTPADLSLSHIAYLRPVYLDQTISEAGLTLKNKPAMDQARAEAMSKCAEIVARHIPDPLGRPPTGGHSKARRGRDHARASLGSPELDSQAVLVDWVEETEGKQYRPLDEKWSEGSMDWARKVAELCGSRDPKVRTLALSSWKVLVDAREMLLLVAPNIPARQVVLALATCVRNLLPFLGPEGSRDELGDEAIGDVEAWCQQPTRGNVEKIHATRYAVEETRDQHRRNAMVYHRTVEEAADGQSNAIARLPRLQGIDADLHAAVMYAIDLLCQLVLDNASRFSTERGNADEPFGAVEHNSPMGKAINAVAYVGGQHRVQEHRCAAAGPKATDPRKIAAEVAYWGTTSYAGAGNSQKKADANDKKIRQTEKRIRDEGAREILAYCGPIIASVIPDPTGQASTSDHAKARRRKLTPEEEREAVLLDAIEDVEKERPEPFGPEWAQKVVQYTNAKDRDVRRMAVDTLLAMDPGSMLEATEGILSPQERVWAVSACVRLLLPYVEKDSTVPERCVLAAEAWARNPNEDTEREAILEGTSGQELGRIYRMEQSAWYDNQQSLLQIYPEDPRRGAAPTVFPETVLNRGLYAAVRGEVAYAAAALALSVGELSTGTTRARIALSTQAAGVAARDRLVWGKAKTDRARGEAELSYVRRKQRLDWDTPQRKRLESAELNVKHKARDALAHQYAQILLQAIEAHWSGTHSKARRERR